MTFEEIINKKINKIDKEDFISRFIPKEEPKKRGLSKKSQKSLLQTVIDSRKPPTKEELIALFTPKKEMSKRTLEDIIKNNSQINKSSFPFIKQEDKSEVSK